MKVRTWGLILLIGVVGLTATGCKYAWVKRDSLDRYKAQIEQLKDANAELQSRLKAQVALNVELTQKADAAVEKMERAMADQSASKETLEALRQINQSMQDKVEELKQEKAAYRKRVEELEKRLATIEGMNVEQTARGLVMKLSGDVAFDPGKADLKPEAKKTLDQVAKQLKNIEGAIRVAGHTDSTPVIYSPYGNNLNLSGARAMSVLNYLAEQGVGDDRMHFAGYGAHKPIMKDGQEDKDASRRVEIILLDPNVSVTELELNELKEAAEVPEGKLQPEEKSGKVTPEAPKKSPDKTPPMK